ncbi:uncharacterized protein LOC126668762 [Mercurialis annua]|uniref:uncharacterized protein LOC126668762 n=1 Tax=Mercurialis annua TaxID=3986 RepID=UPI00215E2A19|nr:uncharacterized protein LOC126668762 [Mercurialis annua]
MRVYDGTNSFLFTVVYASPNASLRQHFWADLTDLANSMMEPWILGGDFNASSFDKERKGGASDNAGWCKSFRKWFELCKMVNLGFCGSPFTWKRGNLLKRLDIFVCNKSWVGKFAYHYVLHLPRLNSDHNPIFIRFHSQRDNYLGSKPFKFQATRIGNGGFKDMIARQIPPKPNYGDDIIYWGHSSLGLFTTNTAYKALEENKWSDEELGWKIV